MRHIMHKTRDEIVDFFLHLSVIHWLLEGESVVLFSEGMISWINHCQTSVLGLGLGVDFTFACDNHNHNNHNNPHLNFVKGTVLGDKEQGVGIRDKG